MKKLYSLIAILILSGYATHKIVEDICTYDQYGGGVYKNFNECKSSDEFQKLIRESKFKSEITKGEIVKGMSVKELYQSWGNPIKINTYMMGRKIQHIYKSQSYVYTLDGKVTNWQNFLINKNFENSS